jgi:hypothetical protein
VGSVQKGPNPAAQSTGGDQDQPDETFYLSHMRNHYYLPLLALVSFCWCVVVSPLKAQQLDVQEWPNGQVILATGDTLYGSVVYHQTEEVIRLVRQDGTNQAFTPVGVRSFTVTDDQSQYQKVFRSYFWNRGNDYSDYQVPAFFQVLQEGPYTLVKREVISFRNQNLSPMYAGYSRYYDPYGGSNYPGYRSQAVILDMLFLYSPQQKIQALRKPRRDLEDLYGNKSGAMKKFIKTYNLSYNDTGDVMKMIWYFNSL